MVNYKPNCVSSCIIIAEIDGEEYRIYTSIKETQKCKDIIEEVYKGRCKRVYISGFDLVKENDNITSSEVIDRIRKQRPGKKEHEKTLLYSR